MVTHETLNEQLLIVRTEIQSLRNFMIEFATDRNLKEEAKELKNMSTSELMRETELYVRLTKPLEKSE